MVIEIPREHECSHSSHGNYSRCPRPASHVVQRFRVKCGLLGSEAGKGQPFDLGKMFANDAKTVYILGV